MRLFRAFLILVALGAAFVVFTGRYKEIYGTCHVAVAGTSATVTFSGVLAPRQCAKMITEGEGKILPIDLSPTGGRVCHFDAKVESIEVRAKEDAREAATQFCDQLKTALGNSKLWTQS